METLEDALDSLSQKRKKLLVEKEELEDLKEEMADYQEVKTLILFDMFYMFSSLYPIIYAVCFIAGFKRASRCSC